jgi:hypothetical protein
LKEKNVSTWSDFRKSITDFQKDRAQKYDNVEASRETILADYRRIIDDIDGQMDKYFSTACRPATKCVVERVPTFKEATSPMAYYFPPALDGKTPGTFFANLRSIDEIDKFKMYALAYHEAVPGHHFQVENEPDSYRTASCLFSVERRSIIETVAFLSSDDSVHRLHGRLGSLHRTIGRRIKFLSIMAKLSRVFGLSTDAFLPVSKTSARCELDNVRSLIDWSLIQAFIGNDGHVNKPLNTW